jgi:PTS system ascorbate-specific IIA component
VRFIGGAADWEGAVRESCVVLAGEGIIDPEYADEVIGCVKEHGPYIVLMPGYALPHSMETSAHCHGTGISFMKMAKPVSFDDADPEKSASVFFTLAAKDHDAHLKNMRKLWTMLTDQSLVEDLLKVQSVEDMLALDTKYSA